MIIGIGTDIIEIQRISEAIHKTPTFLNRVYTKREQDYFTNNRKRMETLAGLFAAKEAVSKALGTGFRQFSLGDIEVVPNALGKPEVTLLPKAKEVAEKLGVLQIHITISHCQTYAVAYAIAQGDELR